MGFQHLLRWFMVIAALEVACATAPSPPHHGQHVLAAMEAALIAVAPEGQWVVLNIAPHAPLLSPGYFRDHHPSRELLTEYHFANAGAEYFPAFGHKHVIRLQPWEIAQAVEDGGETATGGHRLADLPTSHVLQLSYPGFSRSRREALLVVSSSRGPLDGWVDVFYLRFRSGYWSVVWRERIVVS